MKILDRYAARQVVPVWLWCIMVFVSLSILVDLFGRLEDILRNNIPISIVARYYLNFIPLVFVRASPLALLFSTTFVAIRLVRHQELLAMNAGGLSRLRASLPFLAVGWLIGVGVFMVNESVVPKTAATYEQMRQGVFRGPQREDPLENVATIDTANRLYHARLYDPKRNEFFDMTILEHDAHNKPRKMFYVRRAIPTRHGWLLLDGAMSWMGPEGLFGAPQSFVERLYAFPVTVEAFRQPESQPETLSFAQLRQLIRHLRRIGITDTRRYVVELAAKITVPFMNMLLCLIGFVTATAPHMRGRMREFGSSLGWGVAYYLGVATCQGFGKEGLLPPLIAVWVPHIATGWLCVRTLWQRN